jgi:putative SOS response-associated peptidase YedK
MCARYTLRTPADLLAERFGIGQVPDLRPRYNIAATQPVPVIGTKAGGHPPRSASARRCKGDEPLQQP